MHCSTIRTIFHCNKTVNNAYITHNTTKFLANYCFLNDLGNEDK